MRCLAFSVGLAPRKRRPLASRRELPSTGGGVFYLEAAAGPAGTARVQCPLAS
jgi:hypothetical protein